MYPIKFAGYWVYYNKTDINENFSDEAEENEIVGTRSKCQIKFPHPPPVQEIPKVKHKDLVFMYKNV